MHASRVADVIFNSLNVFPYRRFRLHACVHGTNFRLERATLSWRGEGGGVGGIAHFGAFSRRSTIPQSSFMSGDRKESEIAMHFPSMCAICENVYYIKLVPAISLCVNRVNSRAPVVDGSV